MKNILPLFKTFTVDSVRENNFSKWVPASSDPANLKAKYIFDNHKSSNGLRVERQPPFQVGAPPNKRYASTSFHTKNEPSPLSEKERGLAEETKIEFDQDAHTHTKSIPIRSKISKHVKYYFQNNLLESMDCFVQKPTHMRTEIILAGGSCMGCISGPYVSDDNIPLVACFSTPLRNCITITAKHDIRDFEFSSGPIGLEVEMVHHRLTCTKVVPHSQASIYGSVLEDSTIVAVNGVRVVTLEEFQLAMHQAKQTRNVVLKLAVFSGNKAKLKNVFMNEKRLTTAKSLLSHMKHGMDEDFQHGVVLPDAKSESGDECDEDRDEMCLQSQSHQHVKVHDGEQFEDDDDEQFESHSSDGDSSVGRGGSGGKYMTGFGTFRSKRSPGPNHVAEQDTGEEEVLVAGATRNYKHDSKHETIEFLDEDGAVSLNGQSVQADEKDLFTAFEDDGMTEKSDASDTWEYATALEDVEHEPFKQLVCVPAELAHSLVSGFFPHHHFCSI